MTNVQGNQWQPLVDQILLQSKPLIVVLGPTASGKTGLSIQLGRYINNLPLSPAPSTGSGQALSPGGRKGAGRASIINGDSRQLYKFLNIGTAKITDEEKQGIPHELFDVLDPKEDISIAQYKEMAMREIDQCHQEGLVPILVGGSMLYISAVVDGLDPLPPADPEIRKRLEAAWDADDGWTLYDKLVEIDPVTAKSFEKQNKRYVVRAMELYEMTGKPPSTLKKTMPPPYNILQFGMHWNREELVKRIDERTHQLLQSGWIEEVEGLIDKGYTIADPGMKSHGYREIMQWLSSDDRDTQALEEVIAAKTRQYAKRQMTWWNDDNRIQWVDARNQS
jgi:tRNA dimethylallyltransferase